MTGKEITSEEAVLKLRQMVTSFTGIDPRVGQVVKPIQPISEEETSRAMDELFKTRKKK